MASTLAEQAAGSACRGIQCFIYRPHDRAQISCVSCDSLDDLRAIPWPAPREPGHQLDEIQHGLEPDDWTQMTSVSQREDERDFRGTAGAMPLQHGPGGGAELVAAKRLPGRGETFEQYRFPY